MGRGRPVATFRAVAALHYAVTGQSLSMTVETENGVVGIIDTPTPVRSVPVPAAEQVQT